MSDDNLSSTVQAFKNLKRGIENYSITMSFRVQKIQDAYGDTLFYEGLSGFKDAAGKSLNNGDIYDTLNVYGDALAMLQRDRRADIPRNAARISEYQQFRRHLDEKVMDMAMAWLDKNPVQNISFNMESGRLNGGFVEAIEKRLRDYPEQRKRLIIEITERDDYHLKNPAAFAATAGQLKKMGVALALDDFGDGCHDLKCIKMAFFSNIFQYIKLGSVYTDKLVKAPQPAQKVAVQLIRRVQAKAHLVGENVETTEAADILRGIGIAIQGYVYDRPQEVPDLHPLKQPTLQTGRSAGSYLPVPG